MFALALHGAIILTAYWPFHKAETGTRLTFQPGVMSFDVSTQKPGKQENRVKKTARENHGENKATPRKYFEKSEVSALPVLENKKAQLSILSRFYPEKKKLSVEQATVVVEIFLRENGGIEKVRIAKSAGDEFDRAAIRIASLLRFRPATISGEPVAMRFRLPIPFRLR